MVVFITQSGDLVEHPIVTPYIISNLSIFCKLIVSYK